MPTLKVLSSPLTADVGRTSSSDRVNKPSDPLHCAASNGATESERAKVAELTSKIRELERNEEKVKEERMKLAKVVDRQVSEDALVWVLPC